MIRRCGDVFEVNFGYRRGYKQEGLRPAIIVQADYYCELLTLWVIPMVLCPRWAICLTTLARLKVNQAPVFHHTVLFQYHCGPIKSGAAKDSLLSGNPVSIPLWSD